MSLANWTSCGGVDATTALASSTPPPPSSATATDDGATLQQQQLLRAATIAGAECGSEFLGRCGRAAVELCNEASSTTAEALDVPRFVIYGVVLHAVCVLGVLGNGATLAVLRRREFARSSSTVYLKVMMTFDTLYLVANYVHYVLISGLQLVPWDSSPLPAYSRVYVVYVLSDFFRNVGVLLTVAATVERYIFIRHSMHASKLCTVRRARVASASLVAVAACLQVPRALTLRVELLSDGGGGDNGTCTAAAAAVAAAGSSGEYTIVSYQSLISEEFGAAQDYFAIVVFMLLPVGGLMVMTAILLSAINKSNALRRSLSVSAPTRSLEINISAVLLSVVVTYIVCSLPMLVIGFVRMYVCWAPFLGTPAGAVLYYVALTVLNVNAAINVLLFCVFGKKFRRQFKKTFLSFGATMHRPATARHKSMVITSSLRHAAPPLGGDSPDTSQTLLSGWTKASTRSVDVSSGGFATPSKGSPAAASSVPLRRGRWL